MNNFFKSVLGAKLGKTLAQRSLSSRKPVCLFADFSGHVLIPGTATLSDAGTSGSSALGRSLQKHDLPCNEELAHVDMHSQSIRHQFKTLSYP